MGNIKILDCTLRDGGYVNEWNFGECVIKDILCRMSEAHVDIVECGFLSDRMYDSERSIFNNTDQIRKLLPSRTTSRYVAMIALGEKEISYEKIPECDNESIFGIRLTFHKNEVDRAFEFAVQLMNKGYEVFMQPVGTCMYSDKELLELIDRINVLQPYAFYIVDTLGSIIGTELMRLFHLLDNNLAGGIRIGFHSHNNLQLSFANSQELIRVFTEREIIIDASVLGMGRGAGNLCTELIAQYLNENLKTNYNVTALLEIVDNHLASIKEMYPWGYTIPYYIAAVNKCHPNYAIYLMSRQTVTVKDIEKILVSIPKDKRAIYNKGLIEQLYNEYQTHTIDDTDVCRFLSEKWDNKKILLLAPGKTLVDEKELIQEFIKKEKPHIISVNFIDEIYNTDMIFVSNLKRFEKYSMENSNKDIIITSNINVEQSDHMFMINYSDYLNADSDISDNAGLMLCQLLKKCGVNEVVLAGFDGFGISNTNNYFKKDLDYTAETHNLEVKTRKMKEQFKKLQNDIRLSFITTSQYAKE